MYEPGHATWPLVGAYEYLIPQTRRSVVLPRHPRWTTRAFEGMSKKPHFPHVPSFPSSIPTKATSPDILDIPGNLITGLGAGEVDAETYSCLRRLSTVVHARLRRRSTTTILRLKGMQVLKRDVQSEDSTLILILYSNDAQHIPHVDDNSTRTRKPFPSNDLGCDFLARLLCLF